ncbi:hypothetical protein [Desulfoferula mesophila]
MIDVIASIKHDNNHILNTIYLYFVGRGQAFYIYRLLAVACGIGSLMAIWRLAVPAGKLATLLTLFFTGFSYPLVLLFSEARGYAPAILCSLLAYLQLRRCRERLSAFNIVIFMLVNILGLLSHATFAIVLLALFTATTLQRGPSPLLARLKQLVLLYLIPLLALALLYFGFVRVMTIGGGDSLHTDYLYVVGHFAALLFGLPNSQPWTSIALAGYLAVVIGASYQLYRQRDNQWLFYPCCLALFPLAMIVATRPRFIYWRYFVLTAPFLYFLIARLISKQLIIRKPLARLLIICLFIALMGGQFVRLERLVLYGRGGYMAALAYIALNTKGAIVTIGSDDDIHNTRIVGYYKARLPAGKTITYVMQNELKSQPPQWFITHTEATPQALQKCFDPKVTTRYRFQKEFLAAGESGWPWMIYRNE